MIGQLDDTPIGYGYILTREECRFVVDTLRNIAFDLEEDDPDKWDGQRQEIEEALNVLGESLTDDPTQFFDDLED